MNLQDKINVIASVFGAKTGAKATSSCRGKWRGTVDYSIVFDNGVQIFIGNSSHKTGRNKFKQLVDETYVEYNPLTVHAAKEYALEQLKLRAPQDNAIAEQMGFLPYEVMSVELSSSEEGVLTGSYYVVLRIGENVVNHITSCLHYDIHNQKFAESVKNYYTAGGLKDEEVDYIFNGVGFSTKSPLYKVKSEMVFYKMVTGVAA